MIFILAPFLPGFCCDLSSKNPNKNPLTSWTSSTPSRWRCDFDLADLSPWNLGIKNLRGGLRESDRWGGTRKKVSRSQSSPHWSHLDIQMVILKLLDRMMISLSFLQLKNFSKNHIVCQSHQGTIFGQLHPPSLSCPRRRAMGYPCPWNPCCRWQHSLVENSWAAAEIRDGNAYPKNW